MQNLKQLLNNIEISLRISKTAQNRQDPRIPLLTKPLKDSEAESLKESLVQLRNYPNSERIFNELFSKSLEIITKNGCKFKGPLKEQRYFSYFNKAEDFAFEMTHGTVKMTGIIPSIYNRDMLQLTVLDDNSTYNYILRRAQGVLTAKRIKNLDEVEVVAKGITFKELIGGLRSYEPYSLSIGETLKGKACFRTIADICWNEGEE